MVKVEIKTPRLVYRFNYTCREGDIYRQNGMLILMFE